MSGQSATNERHSRARPGDEIGPTRYRKKPVEIEAMRWCGTNLKEMIDFTGLNPSADKWTWEEYEDVVREKGFKIFSLEASYIVPIGHYIIKGVKGEFYACEPSIFRMTYERADTVSETVSTDDSAETVESNPKSWIAWKRRYEEEYAIVDRCWKALGVSTYEQANGKAIDQLIAERCTRSAIGDKERAEKAEKRLLWLVQNMDPVELEAVVGQPCVTIGEAIDAIERKRHEPA